MRAALLPALVLLAGACSSQKLDFSRLSAETTPGAWKTGTQWTFVVTGLKREVRGGIILVLLDEPAKTCSSGDWKRARIVSTTVHDPPLTTWYGEPHGMLGGLYPAYEIHGRYLHVLLNAPICDNDWTLRGELTEQGATGFWATEGMLGGEQIGYFMAVRSE